MTTPRRPTAFTLFINPHAPDVAALVRDSRRSRAGRGLTLLALVAGSTLAACSSMPAANAQLDRARSDYRLAQADPQTQQLAPAELKQAADALALADASLARSDDTARTSQLAYLARQRVALAVEAAGRKGAEAQVASAGAERDQLRLAARTQEADAANQNAASANRDAASANQNAASANRQAATAQQQTDMANRQSAEAKRQSAEAQRQSADARQQAAGATQDANRARQDASNARQQAADANQQTLTAQQQAAQMQAKADGAEQRNQSLAEQLRALDAKQTDRGMVITMGDMLFDTDQARLKPGGVRSLARLGAFLKAYPQRKAAIEGYTDSVGSDSHNQALSERRAEAVRVLLVGMGVGSGQLAAQGYGETHPVAGNDSAGGRQMNRRVEVVLSDDAGVVTPR